MARRSPADGAALDPALTQKKRARRRLVGAIVLGIVAAIVLPLVLDSEPRQTITDVEIEIPPREAALPALDSSAQPAAGVAEDAVVPPPAPAEPIASTKPDPGAEAQLPPKVDAKPSPDQAPARVEPKPEAGPAATRRSSAKTEAPKAAGTKPHSEASAPARSESGAAKSSTPRSESRPEPASAGASRFALQLGAFANAGSARAQLDKARRTGLRAYTETVSTAQGDRTRVRVGPFASREEAEKARATLKLSGIDSSIVDAR